MRRRDIDDEGRIECGMCGEGIYIWNYYTQPVLPGASFIDVWYEKDGVEYGRPKSYCRACNYISQKGMVAIMDRKAECALRRSQRVDDIETAWMKAHYEWNRRDFEENGFPD